MDFSCWLSDSVQYSEENSFFTEMRPGQEYGIELKPGRCPLCQSRVSHNGFKKKRIVCTTAEKRRSMKTLVSISIQVEQSAL